MFQGKKKHININKFAGLSRDWVGAKKLFMCFFGSFLMGEKKHINKIPPKSRDNPVKILFMCFFLYVCFSFPNVMNASIAKIKCEKLNSVIAKKCKLYRGRDSFVIILAQMR